mmetsp:Transcript_5438/g.7874  ORF Transcript_5438/g.7874 Transcript_5438/m.7874 type:complete len:86 (+) Transcript_5438:526-783(+)
MEKKWSLYQQNLREPAHCNFGPWTMNEEFGVYELKERDFSNFYARIMHQSKSQIGMILCSVLLQNLTRCDFIHAQRMISIKDFDS